MIQKQNITNGSQQMFPPVPVCNLADCRFGNVEFFCKAGERMSSRPQGSNFSYLMFFKFRRACFFSKMVSLLFHHVEIVIDDRSKKQMRWTDTASIVAFVTNTQPLWDVTEMDLPRKPMSEYVGSIWSALIDLTMPPWHFAASPIPAIFSFFNFGPKSFLKRDMFSFVNTTWHRGCLCH